MLLLLLELVWILPVTRIVNWSLPKIWAWGTYILLRSFDKMGLGLGLGLGLELGIELGLGLWLGLDLSLRLGLGLGWD